MKITLNPDPEVVQMIREGLERTGGYGPCRAERIEDNRCMCKEFRSQIDDPEYEGYFSTDDYTHLEVFTTATPEPGSAAAENDFR